jgi:hypothetical protein
MFMVSHFRPVQFARSVVQIASGCGATRIAPLCCKNYEQEQFGLRMRHGHNSCTSVDESLNRHPEARAAGWSRSRSMNLALWLPLLFILGLTAFALLFAFLFACDRV